MGHCYEACKASRDFTMVFTTGLHEAFRDSAKQFHFEASQIL